MKRLIQFMIVISIMLMIWIIASNFPFNEEIYLKEIKMKYTGRIDSIYTIRSKTLKVITDKDSIVIISGLTAELLGLVRVGDSIEKIENKNCCVIKRRGISDTCQYMYFGDQYDFNENIGEYWNECRKR